MPWLQESCVCAEREQSCQAQRLPCDTVFRFAVKAVPLKYFLTAKGASNFSLLLIRPANNIHIIFFFLYSSRNTLRELKRAMLLLMDWSNQPFHTCTFFYFFSAIGSVASVIQDPALLQAEIFQTFLYWLKCIFIQIFMLLKGWNTVDKRSKEFSSSATM